jgi:hypothetical protein
MEQIAWEPFSSLSHYTYYNEYVLSSFFFLLFLATHIPWDRQDRLLDLYYFREHIAPTTMDALARDSRAFSARSGVGIA